MPMASMPWAVPRYALDPVKIRGGTLDQVRLPAGIRVAAACTIVLWLAEIYLGRAIAYDDSIWGEWSPAELQGADPQ